MSNNKQQTAVDWFAQQVLDNWNDIHAGARDIMEFLNKAEEIDKEQKRKDCNYWEQMGVLKALKVPNRKTFEQYYNETYGNNHIGDVNEMVGGEQ
jgi:hypothetical protein